MWLKSIPSSTPISGHSETTLEERRLVLVVFFGSGLHISESEIIIGVVTGGDKGLVRLLGPTLSHPKRQSKRVDAHPIVRIRLSVVALAGEGREDALTISQKNHCEKREEQTQQSDTWKRNHKRETIFKNANMMPLIVADKRTRNRMSP